MEDFVSAIESQIRQNALLPAGSGVIAGVSGGPDSMALLALLVQIRERLRLVIVAAHVHHGLRQEADLDEELVRSWCVKYQVEFRSRHVRLREEAKKSGIGLEEAGRLIRREFFLQCRDEMLARADHPESVRIALAHHCKDQAETVLLNIGRGGGLEGLAGMKQLDDPFIRPFLKTNPADIYRWLQDAGIPCRMDESNQDPGFTRNRIRHQLLPVWQEVLGYDPVRMLVRAADNLSADREYMEAQADLAYALVRKTCREASSITNPTYLDRPTFADLPAALQTRMLRYYYREYSGTDKDLSRRHLEQMRAVALGKFASTVLPGPVRFFRRADRLYLETQVTACDPPDNTWVVPLQVPGLTGLPDTYGFIRAEMIEYNPNIRYNSLMNCFDERTLRGCQVRLRRPGDRIMPVGRRGHRTLKKFMNEQSIPVELRAGIPLVVRDGSVAWIPGYACGDEFCIKSERNLQNGGLSCEQAKTAVRLEWISDETDT